MVDLLRAAKTTGGKETFRLTASQWQSKGYGAHSNYTKESDTWLGQLLAAEISVVIDPHGLFSTL